MENENQDHMNITQVFNKLVNIIRSENEVTRKLIREEIANENNKIKKIDSSLEKLNDLEEKYKKLENRCIDLDRRTRKNNLLIFGLSVPEDIDIFIFVIDKINQLLQVNITFNDLNNLYQVKRGNSNFVKLEFVSYLKKTLILRNCNKLKGKGIYIVQDLCFEDRQERKTLQTHLRIARENNFRAKIQGHNLIVNNQKYTINDLEHTNIREQEKVDEDLINTEESQRSNSELPTPGRQTNFEDSLQLFHLNTPLLAEETTQFQTTTTRNKRNEEKEITLQEALPEEKNKNTEGTLFSKTKDKPRTASTSSNSDRNLRQKKTSK